MIGHLPAAVLLAAAAGLAALIVTALLPVHLIEDFAQNSGVAALLPAAQPPLGTTARLVSALAAAAATAPVVWSGLFLLIGNRRVAALSLRERSTLRPPHAAEDAAPVLRRADSHPDAPPRRPLSAQRDLGPPLEPRRPVHLTDAPAGAITERRGAGGARDDEAERLAGVAASAPHSPDGAAPLPPRGEGVAPLPPRGDAPLPLRAATMPEPIDPAPILLPSASPAIDPGHPPERVAAVVVPAPSTAAPRERALPIDLDQPMAGFDPAALLRNVTSAVPQPGAPSSAAGVTPASLSGGTPRLAPGGLIRPQRFAAHERFITFRLDPLNRTGATAPPEAANRDSDAAATIHALLDRLERGVVSREPRGVRASSIPQMSSIPQTSSIPQNGPMPGGSGGTSLPDHTADRQEPCGPAAAQGLEQTLSLLRRLASGSN